MTNNQNKGEEKRKKYNKYNISNAIQLLGY